MIISLKFLQKPSIDIRSRCSITRMMDMYSNIESQWMMIHVNKNLALSKKLISDTVDFFYYNSDFYNVYKTSYVLDGDFYRFLLFFGEFNEKRYFDENYYKTI